MHNGLVISINQFLSCSRITCHTICFFNNTISVQVRYIIIETKEAARVIKPFSPIVSFTPGKMARGKNYYSSVIEPFFPRKNDYIVGFPPGKMAI
jgi:hypothetical protein